MGVRVGTWVAVWVGGSTRGSRVRVGSKKSENREKGVVVVSISPETTRRVTTIVGEESGIGMGVEFPVTGMTMGLGIMSETISNASAAAVLFISAKDRLSSVLRDWRSSTSGGAGSKLDMTKIIQDIPRQIPSASKACSGLANCIRKLRIIFRPGPRSTDSNPGKRSCFESYR
jgi:hypothetical protein